LNQSAGSGDGREVKPAEGKKGKVPGRFQLDKEDEESIVQRHLAGENNSVAERLRHTVSHVTTAEGWDIGCHAGFFGRVKTRVSKKNKTNRW